MKPQAVPKHVKLDAADIVALRAIVEAEIRAMVAELGSRLAPELEARLREIAERPSAPTRLQ